MKRIRLSQGKTVMVDDEDYKWLKKWKWTYAKGRAVRSITLEGRKTKTVYMHKELCQTGPRLQVMHIDGNMLNNQRANLKAVLAGEMRRRRTVANRTGYRGVIKVGDTFIARINHDGKTEYIGSYRRAYDAARAYDRKLIEYVGPNASLNIADAEAIEHLRAQGKLPVEKMLRKFRQEQEKQEAKRVERVIQLIKEGKEHELNPINVTKPKNIQSSNSSDGAERDWEDYLRRQRKRSRWL